MQPPRIFITDHLNRMRCSRYCGGCGWSQGKQMHATATLLHEQRRESGHCQGVGLSSSGSLRCLHHAARVIPIRPLGGSTSVAQIKLPILSSTASAATQVGKVLVRPSAEQGASGPFLEAWARARYGTSAIERIHLRAPMLRSKAKRFEALETQGSKPTARATSSASGGAHRRS